MRLVPAVLCLLLPISATAAVAAPPDVADTAIRQQQRAQVSLTASSAWVRKGGDVTLRGRVEGVRGRATVTIMQRDQGSRRWFVETRKRTTRTGAFRHREDIRSGTRSYKACVKRRCSAPVVVHMGRQPASPTSVTLEGLSPGTVEAGQPFTATGAASANLEGRTIEIQAYDSGSTSWSAVGSATVAGGRWTGTAAISTAGKAVPVRAAFPATVGFASSASTTATITVYGWYYLHDWEPVAAYGDLAGSYDVNGVTYSKSVGLWFFNDDTELIEYNLSRACTHLSTTIGVSDTSPANERVTARVFVDSVKKWEKTGIVLGQSYPITLDISGGLRLRVEGTPEVYGSDDRLIFGDARVLCAF